LSTCIALFRGINVGSAKRLAMADLKALFQSQGFTRVRTLLNSGNVLFDTARPNPKRLAKAIEAAFVIRFGFTSNPVVLTAVSLDRIIAANPLLKSVQDPTRHLVAFASDETLMSRLQPLARRDWRPDAMAVREAAAYLWCAKGVLDSPLSRAFGKAAGAGVTARNWATVLKIQAAAALPD
jgi:uncharacterized protein (DUF1697 family)